MSIDSITAHDPAEALLISNLCPSMLIVYLLKYFYGYIYISDPYDSGVMCMSHVSLKLMVHLHGI